MAFSAVQTATQVAGSGGTVVVTLPAPATIGNLIVVHMRVSHDGTTQSFSGVTDNVGNTYVLSSAVTNGTQNRIIQAYGVQVIGGATTITATVSNFAGKSCRVGADEFSGGMGTNATIIDQTASNTGTGTALSVTLSPTASGRLVVATLSTGLDSKTWTAGTDYTLYSGANPGTVKSQYNLSATTSETAPATINSSGTWTEIATSFIALPTATTAVASVAKILQVKLYDQYFNLKKEVQNYVSLYWEYTRTGGCGQAVLVVMQDFDNFEADFKPKTSVKIVVDNVVRYHGRVLKVLRSIQSGQEIMQVVFYGFMSQLEKIIVREDWANTEVSVIVKDILDTHVVPASDITYDVADIQETQYVVQSLTLNHTVKDAFALLAQLGGNVEWGVDRNRKLFWKQTDPYVRRAYVVGRELNTLSEERSNESVINKLNMFGGAGYISTVQSTLSIALFGTNEANHFESAITEASDANQLGQVLLKQLSKNQRRIQFDYVKDDVFIEATTPLGSTAITKSNIPRLRKYATFKYGAGIKYGNFTQDQITLIRYTLEGGGMRVQISLEDQIPSLSTQQKQIEYQLRELQRR